MAYDTHLPEHDSKAMALGPPRFCRGDVRWLITNDMCLASHRLPAVCRIVPTKQYVRPVRLTMPPAEILLPLKL